MRVVGEVSADWVAGSEDSAVVVHAAVAARVEVASLAAATARVRWEGRRVREIPTAATVAEDSEGARAAQMRQW